jgi:hypothetical protein
METFSVKPATGLDIRDPDLHDLLPPEGREVPKTTYWIRRESDGDVIAFNPVLTVEVPKIEPEPTKASKK